MERKIGEVFECNSKKYIVKEDTYECKGCAFFNNICMANRYTIGDCTKELRSDKKGVIFVEYKEKVMENLLNCKGKKFRCKIYSDTVEGKIQVENGNVYLCQNIKDGLRCTNRFGYIYSWKVGNGNEDDLKRNNVTEFELIGMTKEEIENYKDWQVGDKIIYKDGFKGEIIFRSGELVVFKYGDGSASPNRTVEKLYEDGWRLDEKPMEEPMVEMTMEEIAKLKGIPVEKLRIKDK